MNFRRELTLLAISVFMPFLTQAQEFKLKSQILDNPENEPVNVYPVPHDRQVKWMETEFYAFFHYGMNTYRNVEWGYGDEPETLFAPTEAPDPEQWLTAVKAAGMRGGIAVVKHHDGFCLWPTATTPHCVTNSGNANGVATNIPRDFAAAAKKLDLKYGFYVSPWDRNSEYYGDGTNRYVTDVFLRQCDELAKYGDDQFEMWFDGANGGDGYYGGARTTRSIDRSTYYDIPNLRDSVHKICKNCVMWGVGAEARWIGNEAGWAGQTNWCMKNTDSEKGNEYGDEDGWMWNAGESDAKATTAGWFWHDGQQVRSLDELWKFYMETVGRNATLILNFPPDKRGKLPDSDVQRLKELGYLLKQRLGNDRCLAEGVTVTATETRANGVTRTYDATNMIDGDADTYWAPNDGTINVSFTIDLGASKPVGYVALQEYIRKGQRVKSFKIETSANGTSWTKFGGNVETTTIGYKRIIPQSGSTTTHSTKSVRYVKVTIEDSKDCPLLHTVSIF